MLTQDQINEKINKIIEVLEELDIPYKSLDNQDGSRHGIRWLNNHYITVVDSDERESFNYPENFMYYDPEQMILLSYSDMDDFIRQLKEE